VSIGKWGLTTFAIRFWLIASVLVLPACDLPKEIYEDCSLYNLLSATGPDRMAIPGCVLGMDGYSVTIAVLLEDGGHTDSVTLPIQFLAKRGNQHDARVELKFFSMNPSESKLNTVRLVGKVDIWSEPFSEGEIVIDTSTLNGLLESQVRFHGWRRSSPRLF